MPDTPATIRFGVFEADLRTGELRKSGRRVSLQDQPFRVLAALLESPGELVTREQLKARIWPDDTLIDFDHALTTAVKKLRRVLRDSATHPRYVETLPKRGYRFIAPVDSLANGDERLPATWRADQPAATLRRQRNGFALALAGVLAVLGWSLWQGEAEERQPTVRRFSFTPEAPLSRGRRSAVISPDGRYIAYVTSGAESGLWIRDIDQETPRRLEGTAGASSPFWSPDSEFLAFGAGYELKKISVHGGVPIVLCDLPETVYAGGAWRPDGNSLLFSAGLPPTLLEVLVDGGDPRVVFEPVVTEGGGGNYDVVFLPPDVRPGTILFSAGGPASREIIARDLNTGEQTALGQGARPVYARSGHVIFQGPGLVGGLWAMPFSAESLKATGPAEPIEDGALNPSLAGDETLVFVRAATSRGKDQLVLRDRKGTRLRAIGQPHDTIGSVMLSPDGRRVAVAGTNGGDIDIWVHDLEGETRSRLSFEPVVEGNPVWSSDGREIIYRADRSAETELLRAGTRAGSGKPLDLHVPGRGKRPTDWSPTTQELVYTTTDPQSGSDLWRLRVGADGVIGEPEALVRTPFSEVAGQVSPDGRWLAYCSNESGQYHVYTIPMSGGGDRWQVTRTGGCQPRWSRGGTELLYVTGDRLMATAVEFSEMHGAQIGPETQLMRSPTLAGSSPHRMAYDVSADGALLVMWEPIDMPEADPAAIHVVENWRAAYQDVLAIPAR